MNVADKETEDGMHGNAEDVVKRTQWELTVFVMRCGAADEITWKPVRFSASACVRELIDHKFTRAMLRPHLGKLVDQLAAATAGGTLLVLWITNIVGARGCVVADRHARCRGHGVLVSAVAGGVQS